LRLVLFECFFAAAMIYLQWPREARPVEPTRRM
jgi:hypothetical protein